MLSRETLHVTDYMSPAKTESLRLTLLDFLPKSNGSLVQRVNNPERGMSLRPAHHLVYFPFLQTTSELLPDGTDTWHDPGRPFTRRMWAGGEMAFRRAIPVNGLPFHCIESIKDVQVKGTEGQEKVFVKVQKAMYAGKYPGELKHQRSKEYVTENRTLVFMRDRLHDGSPAVSNNVLRPTQTPDFSHTLVPTREMLFRFSALTFNAHAIHLDKSYCREVEWYRNLLVHGPLTVLLMVEVLQDHLRTLAQSSSPSSTRSLERITHVEYKNLVPLYAEEQMRICVRRKDQGRERGGITTWDVWIEGRDGGYAVKGTVKTFRNQLTGYKPSEDDILHEPVLEEESIPKENIALQSAINATRNVVASENDTLGENVSAEEKTEFEAKEEAEEEAAPSLNDNSNSFRP